MSNPNPLFTKLQNNPLFLAIYLVVIFLTSLSISYFTLQLFFPKNNSLVNPTSNPKSDDDITEIITPTEPPQDELNIILLGHGDAGHDGGHLTDSITLAHFDLNLQKLALISIPRDLWVDLPGGKTNKLNAAYAQDFDKASVIKQAIQKVTGLTPHYFIGVDFFGIQAIIDELDGIEITLEETFEDPFYPIRGRELDLCGMSPEKIEEVHQKYSGFQLERQFECRYEQIYYKQGTHQINGAEALKIARSRHGSSDFARSQRQQAILLGIKQDLLSLDAVKNAPDIFKQLSHTFTSDIDLGAIAGIAPTLTNIKDFQITQINLSTENTLTESTGPQGQYILIPQQNQSLSSYIQSQLN